LEQVTAEVGSEVSLEAQAQAGLRVPDWKSRVPAYAFFALLVAAVFVWMMNLRTPLWLDETVSYFQISHGFGSIWARRGGTIPFYGYLLCLSGKILGTSEIALRIPSILAMSAALFVLFRIAREFFDINVSLLITLVFAVHPIVVFESIDARPYAFGALAINTAILSLVRWVRTRQTRYAVLFGVLGGLVIYFHYLFCVILPAFALILLAAQPKWPRFRAQLTKAAVVFFAMMVPVVSGFLYLAKTSTSHVWSRSPEFGELLGILNSNGTLLCFGFVALIAAALHKFKDPESEPELTGVVCVMLAFIPLALLFGVSRATPIHIFIPRYCLVAIPGVALCWGLLLSRINSRLLQIAFAVGVLASAINIQVSNPGHGYSWKGAISAANVITASDHAPVLMCSDLPESDSRPMPADPFDSDIFSPLSYYKVNSPVVPLPRALNPQARAQVQDFLASNPHRRFVALAFGPSWPTLRWITDATSASYTVREIGVFDGVAVLEFTPR
jgi:mannosyltransferase